MALGLIIGLGSAAIAGATAYSGYQTQKAANRQAKFAREEAARTRRRTMLEIQQMQQQSAQSARQFEQSLAEGRRRTAAATAEAEKQRQITMQQIAQQKSASARALQQQQLAASIQRQSRAAKVSQKQRKRVGSPGALRTAVEAQSALALGGPSQTTQSGVGGLNV